MGLHDYLIEKYDITSDELKLWIEIKNEKSEIEQADVLFKSVNTIKTWRKSLYSKLKAGNSDDANYSQKRAIKDAKDREDKLETAAQLLKNQSLLKKKAQHYFLQESQTGKFELNQQKIGENKRFDGFLAIATSAMDLDIELALDHYRHLFQIEHSFRTYKSFLETRPMFHWTDKRIQGHICLCYLTYTLITYVQNKLKTLGKKLTENQIREAVNAMQVSLVNNHGIKFFLRSSNKPNVDLLTNELGLRKLPNILPESEIYNYL